MIQTGVRSIFVLYWFVDNYLIIAKILFGRKKSDKKGQKAFWFWGSVFALALGIL